VAHCKHWLVVIDIDGEEGMKAIAEAGYVLPSTPRVRTSRGWHLYCRTEKTVKSVTNLLPKVDIRGDGGYVIAPPSMHVSGGQYKWYYLLEQDLAPCPQWVQTSQRGAAPRQTGVIPEGRRNTTLTKIGGYLRSIGNLRST